MTEAVQVQAVADLINAGHDVTFKVRLRGHNEERWTSEKGQHTVWVPESVVEVTLGAGVLGVAKAAQRNTTGRARLGCVRAKRLR
jgi:hypothetical protein